MAGFSDAYELSLLKLVLNATAITGIADNTATSPLTNTYLALYTADPTDAGAANNNEATYTGYARVAIARNNGSPAWTCATASGTTTAKNTATVTFGADTVGTNTITHAAIVETSSGVGNIIASGALTSPLVVNPGITPSFAANALVLSLD